VTYEMLFATFSFGIQKLTGVRTLGRAPRSLSRLLDDCALLPAGLLAAASRLRR
jgi:hypothetical protein